MTENTADKLLALPDRTEVSATRRIARLLPVIEANLRDGVSREAILKVLREDGIEISASGFSSALSRLRKKARGGDPKQAPDAKADLEVAPPLPTLRDIARSTPDLQKWEALAKKGEQR